MPQLIAQPTVVQAAENKPKLIREYVGRDGNYGKNGTYRTYAAYSRHLNRKTTCVIALRAH